MSRISKRGNTELDRLHKSRIQRIRVAALSIEIAKQHLAKCYNVVVTENDGKMKAFLENITHAISAAKGQILVREYDLVSGEWHKLNSLQGHGTIAEGLTSAGDLAKLPANSRLHNSEIEEDDVSRISEMLRFDNSDHLSSGQQYYLRLANLDNGLSPDVNRQLHENFLNSFEYISGEEFIQANDQFLAIRAMIFVQARGNGELANKFLDQALSLMDLKDVDLDLVFTNDGWPDVNVEIDSILLKSGAAIEPSMGM
ncbi:MAG: hypothetical protein JJ975_05845 [Bacteroidia bacterium]|nr:hypothetical protein [Bacteroidia bacterium]